MPMAKCTSTHTHTTHTPHTHNIIHTHTRTLTHTHLLVYNKHGYLGAVFAGIEDLVCLIQRAIKSLHLNLSKHLPQQLIIMMRKKERKKLRVKKTGCIYMHTCMHMHMNKDKNYTYVHVHVHVRMYYVYYYTYKCTCTCTGTHVHTVHVLENLLLELYNHIHVYTVHAHHIFHSLNFQQISYNSPDRHVLVGYLIVYGL